ncbi:hypothetical protein [Rhizobium leguminosarum]
MFFRKIAIAMLCPLLVSGCGVSAFDIPKESGAPSVAHIVDRVRCELIDLVKPGTVTRPELVGNNYEVGIQLSLTVNSFGELSPSFNFIDPPNFAFNLGTRLSRAQEQNFVQNLYYSMPQLAAEWDEASARAAKMGRAEPDVFGKCPSPLSTNLAGNLGIKQSVELAFTAKDRNLNNTLDGTGGQFGGYVSFVVTKSLNSFGPTWTLTHFEGPGSLGTLGAVNTDRITFGFAAGGPGKPKGPGAASQQVKDLLHQLNLNQIQPLRPSF